MKTLPDDYDKNNPANWINRPMNGYQGVKKSLMITAEKKTGIKPPSAGYVTEYRSGITLTLCRRIREDDVELAVPIGKNEVVLWNVPVVRIFSDALSNTAKLYPPSIYDLKTSGYIKLHSRQPENNLYDFEAGPSMVAENPDFYDSGMDSGLRFIITAAGIVGDAVIFYPELIRELSRRLIKNPTLLICGPGKVFVFDSGKRKKAIRNYLERYKNEIDNSSFEPYLFRYIKENNVFLELDKDSEIKGNPSKEARIPQGSIISAWGDVSYRRDMLEWKRNRNH